MRVLHPSLGDFLLDQTRSGNYHINQGHAHPNLARYFMKCISRKVRANDDNISGLCGLSFALFTVCLSQSYPTSELLDALWSFNISDFWTLYFSANWAQTFTSDVDITRASRLSAFFTWLENNGSSKEGQNLYSRYVSTWDRHMRHSLTQLSLGPLDSQFIVFIIIEKIRNNHEPHHIFTTNTFGSEYGLLSNIFSTLDLYDGGPRYDLLLTEFFGDPNRSAPFYMDGDKYANFGITFTNYLLCTSMRKNILTLIRLSMEDPSNWERDLPSLSLILSKAYINLASRSQIMSIQSRPSYDARCILRQQNIVSLHRLPTDW